MITEIQVESSDSGRITVPSKLLTDILKTFSDQPLTFLLKDNQLEIIDEKDNYYIAVESAEEYPTIPNLETTGSINIYTNTLAEAINNTLFATGNDAMRPVMTGVFFQFTTKECKFVATDAHRLVKYTRTDLKADKDAEFIMPKKTLQLLKNQLNNEEEEVKIEYNETNAKYTYGKTQIICRLVEGKYPNYEAVIPKDNPNVLTINSQLFSNSIKRAALFANRSTHQLKFAFNGNSVNIKAEDVEFSNKAEITLACDYSGEDMQIGFNSKFLIEMLSNLHSEDLTLEMSVPSKAGILKPVDGLEADEDILMLVMPVMIN